MFLVTGCATSYQAKSFTGGFSETQLSENIFKINFKGNGYTHSERTEDFVLLRSAEITLDHGFTHFIIIDNKQSSDIRITTTPAQTTTYGSISSYGNTTYGSAQTITTGGNTVIIKQPSATNTIMCFNGKPTEYQVVYDAQLTRTNLSKKYGLTLDKKN